MTPDRRSRLALLVASSVAVGAVLTQVASNDQPEPEPQSPNSAAFALWRTLSTYEKARVCDYAATTPDPWEDIQWNAGITKAEWGKFVAFHCAWPAGVRPR